MKSIEEDIKELKKLGIYDPKLIPIKIYCSNFSKTKLGIMWCSKEVGKFLIKYIPEDMIRNIGIDNNKIIYINFKNRAKLKGNQPKTID